MYKTIHSITHRLLPSWLYDRLIGNWDKEGLRKYFSNTSWIILAKVITFIVSFFTLAMVARYLGPDNYGKISYAQSFVAIFSIFATLGIDQVLYRDLIAHPDKEKQILGTAFLAKLVFGLVTFFVTCATALYVNDDIILTLLIGIIAINFIFQPFSVLSHYFNAKVAAKYSSIASIVIAFLIPALKFAVIFLDQGIIYFAAIIAFETIFLASYNVFIYYRIFDGHILNWEFSANTLRGFLFDSWPLMAAGFSGYIYGRIDQVMIQHSIDSSAVGIYDASVRITEICGFLPGVFITSLFPAIVNAKKSSEAEYKNRFKTLSLFSIGLATLIAIFVFLFSPFIIGLIFGPAFAESSAVLKIYIWSLVGAITVSLMQSYLIVENRAKKILILSVIGAFINVILNLYLIPLHGIYGAAIATLLSYVTIVFLFIITEQKIKQ